MENDKYVAELTEKELTMICNLLYVKCEQIDDIDYKLLKDKMEELYYSK